MNDFLIQLVNASFQGGVIIAVVVLLRLILKKAPKSTLCLLWLLAIIRLLLPFHLESRLSLQPDVEIIAQQENQQPGIIVEVPKLPAHAAPTTTIKTDDGQLLHIEIMYSNEDITPEQAVAIDWAELLPWLWLAVATVLLGYSLFSYFKLRQQTRNAIILSDDIWLSPALNTAFVLGFLRPQIYLPAKLTPAERQLVIAHERSHIARLDHWYKLLGYLALCIHWFNPLVWLAYILLCQDIELACDEQVVKNMDTAQRKAYSSALLSCSVDSRRSAAYPVAFAEVSVKDRIKGVLHYKKPGFWSTLVSIVAVFFVAVCFLTNPSVPTQEELYLEQCREALEAWQQMDSRHLREDRVYEGGHILNDSAYSDYWKSGNRYLHISVTPLSGYRRQMNHILMDGKLLSREYTMANGDYGFYASDWEESDIPVSILYSWVDSFDWEAHAVEYIGQQEMDGTTIITLSITEDPAKCGKNHAYTENPYTVSFRFATDGALDQLVMTSWYEYETGVDNETEQGIQQIISTFCLMPENADEVAAEVNHWYTNAEEDLQAE